MATTSKRARPKMTVSGTSDPPKAATPTEAPPAFALTPPPQPSTKSQQQSRIGKRAVTFYVSPEAFRQLRVLSAQTDRTIQELMQEALDWQFQQHDMHRIARD